MRGRKPLPTPIRELGGNAGKRPFSPNEPHVTAHLPPAPSHLSKHAKAEWRRVGRELLRMGLVSTIDRALLTSYCSAWGRLIDAEEKLAQFGSVIKTPGGMLVQSPYLQIVNKAIEQLAKLAPEFGMSPSSRTRVTASTPETTADEFEEMMSRGRSKPA